MPHRIAISNDYDIVVHGLANMLAPFEDLRVVEVTAGHDPSRGPIDVVLLDTYGHPHGSLERIEALATRDDILAVAVLSFHSHRALVDAALARGARSYLSKGLQAEQIADALRRTALGESVVIMPTGRVDGTPWPGRSRGLTERQSELLALLAHGASNRDLANASGLSEHTVKTHLKRVFATLGFTNRAQAAAFAHTDPEFARVLPAPGSAATTTEGQLR